MLMLLPCCPRGVFRRFRSLTAVTGDVMGYFIFYFLLLKVRADVSFGSLIGERTKYLGCNDWPRFL